MSLLAPPPALIHPVLTTLAKGVPFASLAVLLLVPLRILAVVPVEEVSCTTL
jgi:hypothetical protein